VTDLLRVAVLVSGTGTNLGALIEHVHQDLEVPAEIVLVVASRDDAYALERARRAGIPTAVVRREDHFDRAARDRALADVVEGARAGLVVLAGWMSILTADFLGRFPDRVINLHPSMLPAFPGMHAVEEALGWGCRYTGVTVHFVDEEVDGGPPVLQEPVLIEGDDTVDSLRERIREVEHRLLPDAVARFARGEVRRDPVARRRVEVARPSGGVDEGGQR
jgi:phosphoribosylglycinamide formyltransferase-1